MIAVSVVGLIGSALFAIFEMASFLKGQRPIAPQRVDDRRTRRRPR